MHLVSAVALFSRWRARAATLAQLTLPRAVRVACADLRQQRAGRDQIAQLRVVPEGEVLDQRTVDDHLILRARVNERLVGRLRQAGVTVQRDGARGT